MDAFVVRLFHYNNNPFLTTLCSLLILTVSFGTKNFVMVQTRLDSPGRTVSVSNERSIMIYSHLASSYRLCKMRFSWVCTGSPVRHSPPPH
jgi:hypothetical protein